MKKNGLFSKIKLLQATLATATMILLMAFAPSQQNSEEGWTLLASEQGVNSFARRINCGNSHMFLFKFENTSERSLTIKYVLEIKDSKSFGPQSHEATIGSKAAIIGSCDSGFKLALPDYENKESAIQSLVSVSIKINN